MMFLAALVMMILWAVLAPVGWFLGKIAAIFTEAADYFAKRLDEWAEELKRKEEKEV